MATPKKSKPTKTEPRMDAQRVRMSLLTRTMAIRGLTPEHLAAQLEAFDIGYLRGAALLWQKMRDRDDTIKAVAEKRELEASLLNYEILPVDDSPEAKTHKEALEAFYNNCTATHALDQNQRGGVGTLIKQMMHAVGHKYAVHEIVWDPTGTDLTAEFRFTPLQFFENTTGQLRFLASDFATAGEDLEEGGWMVTFGSGLMEATSIAYLFKNLPLKSWLMFCDKFGIPGLHGETTAAYGSDEWNRFRDALANFSQDWALLTSQGGKITPIQVDVSGASPHKELIDRMDRAITRLWRGADLGTMSQKGDATGSNPQQSETDILGAADAMMISETIHHYVDRMVIRYRFGTEPKAYFQLQPRESLNLELQLKIDEALIGWGVPRSIKDLLERYGRPEPDGGEDLATAPQKAPVIPNAAALANDAASAGREAIFKANAAAQELAARRPVFRAIAERLATIASITDPAARRVAAASLQADAATLFKAVISQAPDLAKPAEEAIGTALVDGFAQAAADKAKPTPTK
jgi:hypothetical protein